MMEYYDPNYVANESAKEIYGDFGEDDEELDDTDFDTEEEEEGTNE